MPPRHRREKTLERNDYVEYLNLRIIKSDAETKGYV